MLDRIARFAANEFDTFAGSAYGRSNNRSYDLSPNQQHRALISVGGLEDLLTIDNPEEGYIISLAGVLHAMLRGRVMPDEWIAAHENQGGPRIVDLIHAYPRTNDGLAGKGLEFTIALGVMAGKPPTLMETVGTALDQVGADLDDLQDVYVWGPDKRNPDIKAVDVSRFLFYRHLYYWKPGMRSHKPSHKPRGRRSGRRIHSGRPVVLRKHILEKEDYQGLAKTDLVFEIKAPTSIRGEGYAVTCSVKERAGLFRSSRTHTVGIHFGLCLDNKRLTEKEDMFPIWGIRRLEGLGESLHAVDKLLLQKFLSVDLTERTVKDDRIFPIPSLRALARFLYRYRNTPAHLVVDLLLDQAKCPRSFLEEMVHEELGLKSIMPPPPIATRPS